LALRGNDVRVVEERQNQPFVRTLREHGAASSRHFYQHFSAVQHATWESRTGAQLLEWVTRELALIDVAVAVAGLNDELCQWLANVTRDGLTRAYLTWEPETLDAAAAERLQLDRFDVVLAPCSPVAGLPWLPVMPAITAADADAGLAEHVTGTLPPASTLSDPIDTASAFERIFIHRTLAQVQ
jgi:hypothetical protein